MQHLLTARFLYAGMVQRPLTIVDARDKNRNVVKNSAGAVTQEMKSTVNVITFVWRLAVQMEPLQVDFSVNAWPVVQTQNAGMVQNQTQWIVLAQRVMRQKSQPAGMDNQGQMIAPVNSVVQRRTNSVGMVPNVRTLVSAPNVKADVGMVRQKINMTIVLAQIAQVRNVGMETCQNRKISANVHPVPMLSVDGVSLEIWTLVSAIGALKISVGMVQSQTYYTVGVQNAQHVGMVSQLMMIAIVRHAQKKFAGTDLL